MPLSQSALQARLLGELLDSPKSAEEASSVLAQIINDHIKTALVSVNGTIVGTSPSGPVTGTCTATGALS